MIVMAAAVGVFGCALISTVCIVWMSSHVADIRYYTIRLAKGVQHDQPDGTHASKRR